MFDPREANQTPGGTARWRGWPAGTSECGPHSPRLGCGGRSYGNSMSEIRELLQTGIDQERQYAKEHFDVEFKAVGYLLAANAAGLAGCITLLKDYATAPQLKGIGIFICLFGLGFIFAVVGFIAITFHRQAWLGMFLDGRFAEANPMLYALVALVPNLLSCLLLCGAIALMIGRFAWL